MRNLVLLVVFVASGFTTVFAQDTTAINSEEGLVYDVSSERLPLELNKNKLEEHKNDADFNYEPPVANENWWTSFKRWVSDIWNGFTRWLSDLWYQFWKWILGDSEGSAFWNFVINVLPYIIIVGCVIFIIWLFFKLNPGASLLSSKEKGEIFITEEEEIIKAKDINKLIEKALQQQNYRLAVRYYYLLILKKLTDAEVIEYEYDKTNRDYIAEISSVALHSAFSKATNLYDFIWYGNFSVTESDYRKAERTFTQLVKIIPDSK